VAAHLRARYQPKASQPNSTTARAATPARLSRSGSLSDPAARIATWLGLRSSSDALCGDLPVAAGVRLALAEAVGSGRYAPWEVVGTDDTTLTLEIPAYGGTGAGRLCRRLWEHAGICWVRADTTRRLIHACDNPNVNIIGHPTTRLIGRRAPIDADWDAVFAACGRARTGTALEIDASPGRLDLPADLIRPALRHGAVFAIDSDAHATPHLAHLRYGIATAQRGWLTPDNVINTWPLGRLQEFLRKKRHPHH
jgi:hypothetical protein